MPNRYKRDFPIFKNNPGLVYLDSAATTQKPQVVIDAVREFYATYNANIHRGLYAIAEKATEKVEEVRKKVAKFINAKIPAEIVFTHGTTEGINLLAHGLLQQNDTSFILSSVYEHHSNLVPWHEMSKKGRRRIDYLDIDQNGMLVGRLRYKHNNCHNDNYHYDIVSLAHVSNVLGSISPIDEIIGLLKKQKKISSQTSVIVDAAQSVPHMPVDLQEMPCDFLVFSGHKMFSPTGVGVLYGRDGALSKLKPLIFGSQMVQKVTPEEIVYQEVPQKFEAGTLPIEAIIGLGAAVDYLSSIGMKNVRKHEQELMRYFFERSATIENLIIYGPLDTERRSGVISFNLNGIHAHDVAQVLADDNVCLRSGHHCAMPLHRRLGIEASIRISFQIYNDDEDIDKLIKSLRKVQRIFSCR